MTEARAGDTVKVHYTGKLDDGTVFDTSSDSEPLEFTLGEGQVILGFEQAVMGMNMGDSKTAKIPADEAYGRHRPEMVLAVPRDQFPANITPEVGQQLQIRQPNGQAFVVKVTDIKDDTIVLDANHPLAGQDLTFDIKLVEVTPYSGAEPS
jgi:FKBP-type peptidyl-prolyl cis-trans isomerase 2